MSWYDRHIRQSPFTAHCTVVALLAVTDWILDECVSQSQPLHWLVRFPQEFEFGVIEIRVSNKSCRDEAATLGHMQVDEKVEVTVHLREAGKRQSHVMLRLDTMGKMLQPWRLMGWSSNLDSSL